MPILNTIQDQKEYLESMPLTTERIRELIESFIIIERETADVYEEFFKKLYDYLGKTCILKEQNEAIRDLLEITHDELDHENKFRHMLCVL
jgi:hypothetical protein